MSARITPKQRTHYFKLRAEGFGVAAASREAGFHRSTGWRLEHITRGDNYADEQRILASELPDPKAKDDLSWEAKRSLEDFSYWAARYLAWRPIAWQRDAARRVVDALANRGEKSYGVVNVPPSAGKSTTFTFAIPAWLICGGGSLDPAWGRAIRILLGSRTKKVSEHYVLRLRRLLELRRPYWDKDQQRAAVGVLAEDFGRFRPLVAMGEESIWSREQFVVAQMGEVDLYEKEPTVQAASQESGFLGERVDFESWDDLVTYDNSRKTEQIIEFENWFENEAETRLEPGGVLLLVGQRISPIDLFRRRLDATWTEDATGRERRKYFHVAYPVHSDPTCDGNHRQWDLGIEGCILDEVRFPWKDLEKILGQRNYRTVYQQEDVNPGEVLVRREWIEGGMDSDGYMAPGCLDSDRGFYEWPTGTEPLIEYATVDPSSSGWWVLEWWAYNPESGFRYLIAGKRQRMPAGGLLDWDEEKRQHTGWMQEFQEASVAGGHPIRVWIVEARSAFKHLLEYRHFRTWQRRWGDVLVIAHDTWINKHDLELGVEAAIPSVYRTGHKRLPWRRSDPHARIYVHHKISELTTYPHAATDDTVMADWFGEFNLERILAARTRRRPRALAGGRLPPYLEKQRQQGYIPRDRALARVGG